MSFFLLSLIVASAAAWNPSNDSAAIDECLSSARATAASCACPRGGPARWVDDERCVCDERLSVDTCGEVIARAPGRGTLVVPGDVHLGFTTLLRDFFGHLASGTAVRESTSRIDAVVTWLVGGTRSRETKRPL